MAKLEHFSGLEEIICFAAGIATPAQSVTLAIVQCGKRSSQATQKAGAKSPSLIMYSFNSGFELSPFVNIVL